MSKKIIYKLPFVGETLILESQIPPELVSINKDENDDADKQKELLETISRDSYQNGWNEAIKKVQIETQKNIELMCQSLQKAMEDLKVERNRIWEQCEKEIVKLVLIIGKKAISHEISKGGSKVVEKVVAEAVDKAKGNKILRLHLNPVDFEDFKRWELTEYTEGNKDYEIVVDTDIASGGCKVVTDYGGIDARLETRWSEIEAAFGENESKADQDE